MPIHTHKIGLFWGVDPLNGKPYQRNSKGHIIITRVRVV